MITQNLNVIPVLCTQCGMCEAICPKDAIELVQDRYGCFFPQINKERCTRCDLCVKSCAANVFDPTNISRKVVLNENSKKDSYLGNVLNTYAGYSQNKIIRRKGSSGGVATSLIKFALENNIIQAAVASRLNEEKPFLGEGVVVKNPQDLAKTSGSKFLPIATNSALKGIIRDDKVEKIALVGLPCQIHSLRKAMSELSPVKKKDILLIGLFCKQTKDLRFTEFLLSKAGAKKDDVKHIHYRKGSWPGSFVATLKDGSERSLDRWHPAYGSFPWTLFLYSPIRCLLCSDATAELADLAIGDPWLKEFKKETIGTSLIISRTEKGERILQEARVSGAISFVPFSAEKIIESQSKRAITLKKDNWFARYKLLRLIYKNIPRLELKGRKVSLFDYLDALWIFSIRFFGSSKLAMLFLLRSPKILLKIIAHTPLSSRFWRKP